MTLAKSSDVNLMLSPTSADLAMPLSEASMLIAGERSAVSSASPLASEQETSVLQSNSSSAAARQTKRDKPRYSLIVLIDIPPDFFFYHNFILRLA
jgi:hypothetical protein